MPGYVIYCMYSNNYHILSTTGTDEKVNISFSSNKRNGEPTSDNLGATFEIAANPSSKNRIKKAIISIFKEKINQDLLSINKILTHLGCGSLTYQDVISSLQTKGSEI